MANFNESVSPLFLFLGLFWPTLLRHQKPLKYVNAMLATCGALPLAMPLRRRFWQVSAPGWAAIIYVAAASWCFFSQLPAALIITGNTMPGNRLIAPGIHRSRLESESDILLI